MFTYIFVSYCNSLIDLHLTEKKTIAAFSSLPFLLPAPPKRGVKKPRIGPSAVLQNLYVEMQVSYCANIYMSMYRL